LKSFRKFLLSEATNKNLHLEHLEDEILNGGIDGGRSAINFLRSLRDMLAGDSGSSVNVTTKWDGAPAIFCGIDPSDGKFFVGTKGVFLKNPKIVKEVSDVDKLGYSGDLKEKLTVAIQELPKLGISGVLQGDVMFTQSTLNTENIDGEEYVTFQPNTILYAIPKKSKLARKMMSSSIGVVFHTTYNGDTLEDMTASFGANVSQLNETVSVWFADAEYKDMSGTVTMTKSETTELTKILSKAGSAFHKIDSGTLHKFLQQENTYPSSAIGSAMKTYNNSKIRAGKDIKNFKRHILEYEDYFDDFWETKIIGKLKSDKGIKAKRELKEKYIETIRKSSNSLIALTEFQSNLNKAKLYIVDKLNKGAKTHTKTFVVTDNGYEIVNPEGYVAIDKIKGNAVKLVDRLEFSYNNFNTVKQWDK
tara:strand:+ start:22948 stop:24204 length:1257 start_codon:yes stop_codon:yes gene_type:complete